MLLGCLQDHVFELPSLLCWAEGVSQGKLLRGGCISKCSSVIDSSAFSFPLWHLQIMRYLETGISSAWACQEYYHQCSSQPFLLHTWPLQIWNVKTARSWNQGHSSPSGYWLLTVQEGVLYLGRIMDYQKIVIFSLTYMYLECR